MDANGKPHAWRLIAGVGLVFALGGCFPEGQFFYSADEKLTAATGEAKNDSVQVAGRILPMTQTATSPRFQLEGGFAISPANPSAKTRAPAGQ